MSTPKRTRPVIGKLPDSRAYVISETDDYYTIVSEHDKKTHTIEKQSGSIPDTIQMDNRNVVIQSIRFTDPSRLFTACREYCYDIERKRNSRSKKSMEKKEKALKEKEEKEAKGMMMFGKYKKATYEDILLTDTDYCDWILKQTDKNEEIKKFKVYLQEHYKKDE